ncbi:MAG TPA: hypothetical protein VFN70_18545 [Burkholderiales bacterium]|nr:hypothetical protein [Burkholderiales bacterium]
MKYRNPLPMGTAAAAGQSTDAMRMMMAKAYGSAGGRSSATKRAKKNGTKKHRARKRNGAGKLKFGSPAWRKKFMKNGGKRKR